MNNQRTIERLVFTGGLNALSLCVELGTMSIWSHVRAETNQHTFIHASPTYGVIEEGYWEPFFPMEWQYVFDLSGLNIEKRRSLYVWLKNQCGKPYDFSWIAGYPFDRNWQDDDSWVCSELMGAAMEATDLLSFRKLHRLTPKLLFRAMKANKEIFQKTEN